MERYFIHRELLLCLALLANIPHVAIRETRITLEALELTHTGQEGGTSQGPVISRRQFWWGTRGLFRAIAVSASELAVFAIGVVARAAIDIPQAVDKAAMQRRVEAGARLGAAGRSGIRFLQRDYESRR